MAAQLAVVAAKSPQSVGGPHQGMTVAHGNPTEKDVTKGTHQCGHFYQRGLRYTKLAIVVVSCAKAACENYSAKDQPFARAAASRGP